MKIELDNSGFARLWQQLQFKISNETKPFVFISSDESGLIKKLSFRFEGNEYHTSFSSLSEANEYLYQFGDLVVAERVE